MINSEFGITVTLKEQGVGRWMDTQGGAQNGLQSRTWYHQTGGIQTGVLYVFLYMKYFIIKCFVKSDILLEVSILFKT